MKRTIEGYNQQYLFFSRFLERYPEDMCGKEVYLDDVARELSECLHGFNSSCPRAQNVQLLCFSQTKNRLHRNP